jgi:ParB family chromosome partitioning protein
MNKHDQRRALGKGISALLPVRRTAAEVPPPHHVETLPIDRVTPNPNQPRREFDETALMELAQSIDREGIIQPIIVREMAPNAWQIIAGERRWRAAGLAGLKEVPVIVRTADDEKVLELAIVENIQREDLNPIELAVAFHRMAEELGLSHEEIGRKTGKERTTVTNAVRLLQLPAPVQQMVRGKELSPGHARALLKLADEATIGEVAAKCVEEGWSVRRIEEYTRPLEVAGHESAPRRSRRKEEPKPLDPNVKAAVDQLKLALGTQVRIVEKAGGKGHLEIDYYSAEDLDRIYEMIVAEPERSL